VALPPLSHALGIAALVGEVIFRAWKIQLSARALRRRVGFGAAAIER
jgi:hypothetical protein